jgi:hypothetical protein
LKKLLKKTVFITVFFSVVLFPALLGAEYIFLKNGKIIRGNIIVDQPKIVVALVAGKRERIRRADIIRILYTHFKMGKVYIQKRDGTRVLAFIVDEERESYVCRMKLYSPREFRLRRSDVLFVAEKNPSGLKGKAGMTDAKLSWFPPYDRVKTYNLYMKTGKKDTYRKIASTSKKHISVEDLKSNTKYYFIVRSVDSDDYESSPSNEFAVKTKNIPPLPPGSTGVEIDTAGNYKITWSEATDPDGIVKEYKLYRVLNFKTSLLAATAKKTYRLKKDVKFDHIFIKSFDNLNTESEKTTPVYISHRPEINVAVSPAFVLPSGNLKNVAGPGYGSTLRAGISNYLLPGLDLGIESSFLYFKGKEIVSEVPENGITDIVFAPVQIFAGYSFYPNRRFRISPAVFGGVCYVRERHTYFHIPTSSKKEVTRVGFEPLFGAGLSVRWEVSPWFFALSAGYRYMVENSGSIYYFTLSPSAGIRF